MADTATTSRELHCVVVTPERALLDEPADFIALPLYDGELGVLPGHSPLVARLGFGELRTRRSGQVVRYFVDGGFVQLRDDVATLLTSRALPASEIDPEAVEAELQKARERVARTDAERTEVETALARGRAQLRMAERAS